MPEVENEFPATLPEELRLQFAAVNRRLWWVETIVASGAVILGMGLSVFALFISDRFWNTPAGLRFAFSFLGLVALAVPLAFWTRRWILHRRTQQDLARLVQKRFTRLGDRLLGIVELASDKRRDANVSPALCQAAIRQVAAEASQFDFRGSVNARPAQKMAVGTVAALALWLALGLILPQASWNALLRWAAPGADIPRYTLVQLEGLPADLVVPHGEPFTLAATVQYRSFWHPRHVSAQGLGHPSINGTLANNRIAVEIPGQVENGVWRVRMGDAIAAVKITPMRRPALRELQASVKLPAYLDYPDQTQTVQGGSLPVVKGSEVTFQGATTRNLVSGVMRADDGTARPLAVNAASFRSVPTQPAASTDYTFSWRDDLGLSNTVPLRVSVGLEKDAPPTAALPDLPRESALLVSDVLHVRAEANDDFGVRDLGLTWDVVSDAPTLDTFTSEVKVMMPNSRVKKASRTFLWSPRSFGIPADSTVELQGYARDYLPGRERVRTAPYHIRVLSPEEHAELIRGQLEDVMARVEEVTRLQEKIVANLKDLQQGKLPDSQKPGRIGQSKNDQLQNSAHLNELSDRAASAVQEAMKNSLFTPEMIRQWNKAAQQWQQLAQEKMKDAAAAMQAAQQNPQSRQDQTAQASQKAEDILKALEKMQNQASKHMDDLQALTLAQRLRKISGQEKNLGAQMLKSAPDTIGLLPENLPEKFQRFEHALTTDQGQAEKESDILQGEISRYFERTQKTNYGQVSKEMKEAHTSDELERVEGMISGNIGVQVSGELDAWSKRFQKWSETLEPPPSSDSAQGSGNSSSSKKRDLTAQLIALLRLRENEMNLRDQTSLLDQRKGPPAEFKNKADALADTENKLHGNLEHVRQDVDLPELNSAFDDTGRQMQIVQSTLEKPDTGKPADDAEVKTVDSLSDLINLINEQGQRNSPKQASSGQSSSAEEMAFLMQMMQKTANAKAMVLQPSGGLNRSGGTTDRPGAPVTGHASGKTGGARSVEKVSNVMENSPAEFRDALDTYFHGIEQGKD
jgi:hypothetical protein